MLYHMYHSPTSLAVLRAFSSNDTAHVFCYNEKHMQTAKTEQSETKKNVLRFLSVLFQFMFSKITKWHFFFRDIFQEVVWLIGIPLDSNDPLYLVITRDTAIS